MCHFRNVDLYLPLLFQKRGSLPARAISETWLFTCPCYFKNVALYLPVLFQKRGSLPARAVRGRRKVPVLLRGAVTVFDVARLRTRHTLRWWRSADGLLRLWPGARVSNHRTVRSNNCPVAARSVWPWPSSPSSVGRSRRCGGAGTAGDGAHVGVCGGGRARRSRQTVLLQE